MSESKANMRARNIALKEANEKKLMLLKVLAVTGFKPLMEAEALHPSFVEVAQLVGVNRDNAADLFEEYAGRYDAAINQAAAATEEES